MKFSVVTGVVASVVALGAASCLTAEAATRGCGPTTVQLSVLDQGGSSLPGLSPSDFKVRIKGQSTNVTAVNYGVFPHSTLLLIARSGNMTQPGKWELAQQLAQSVIANAPGTVIAGSYGSEVSPLADARSAQPFAQLVQASTDDRSVLYDAILAGMTITKLHSGDAVVVITDAADNGSKTNVADLRQRFAATGARLFVLALPPADNNGTMQALTDIASATGGTVLVPLEAPSSKIAPSQIEGALINLNRTYLQYNNVYQLETDSDGQDKPLPLRIEIDRRKLGGGHLLAPAMVAPCSAGE